MGLQREPFIAGLASLSVDGGQIMLMDVVIDKLYPVAYINGQKGSREGPWNEDEERSRSDRWKEKYQVESTSLRERLSKRLEGIEDVVETLVSAAQDVEDPRESESRYRYRYQHFLTFHHCLVSGTRWLMNRYRTR